MRLGRFVLVTPFLLMLACAEAPECVAPLSGDGVEIDCSAGKVPVCGDDPALLYNERTGALLPVPGPDVANGSCDGIDGDCRTRPVCSAIGEGATCADGTAPRCVLGRIVEIQSVMPMPDAGPPPTDAGPTDAGPTDAGPTDAGPADAGPTDAGPTDAGPVDAGVDAG